MGDQVLYTRNPSGSKNVVVEVACAAVIGCNAIAAWEIGVEKFIHVLADDDVRVKEDTDVVIC